jgi:hypothetical protein
VLGALWWLPKSIHTIFFDFDQTIVPDMCYGLQSLKNLSAVFEKIDFEGLLYLLVELLRSFYVPAVVVLVL